MLISWRQVVKVNELFFLVTDTGELERLFLANRARKATARLSGELSTVPHSDERLLYYASKY
jgi:hypothetical protein